MALPIPLPTSPVPSGGPTPPYPILTEELGYPPSPVAGGGATSRGGAARNGGLGQIVNKAIQDVLGWKIKPGDANGFVGALNQSFQLKTFEGAVVSTWTPRSYVVQSDLSGGISGAQASIYTMANTLVDQMLPLIDGLYPLDPAANLEDAAAVKDVVTSQLTNLSSEIGYLGGPRVVRVQEYLSRLLGVGLNVDIPPPPAVPSLVSTNRNPSRGSPLHRVFSGAWPPSSIETTNPPAQYWTDADFVLGSLGDLRDVLGLFSLQVENISTHRSVPYFINTIADEQNATNFRILVDYANSLYNAWDNSVQFFAGLQSQFLGTQLVIISRKLGVISEVVDEVCFVLDSVFIGPAQRDTLQVVFDTIVIDGNDLQLPPIYLSDLLRWVQDYVGPEAQDVIQNAGKFGLGEDFTRMISQLYLQAYGLYKFAMSANGALGTPRVLQSLFKLMAQLSELYNMAEPIGVRYLAPRF
jgi:hypothetical protein